MLTPQEVSNHAFAKAVMGGYNMAMVDEFLDELTDDYTSLYKENAALKAKMKVLVDKVEEYRSTEDAMRAALLTAQKMADSMVAEAEEKKKSLLENAESEANRKIGALRDEVAQEERRLTAAKAETADFLARVRELYEREMKLLEELPEADLAPAAPLELAKPAADVSEQISLAGTEASGTGNMKLMMNGAITLGTLDGANVEIHDAVGDENILIFGMTTPEVNELKSKGYVPMNFYNNNAELRNVIDFINRGFCGKQFPEISGTIVYHDPYMVLADFADYRQAQNKIDELWADRTRWNSMSLMNTACSGRFAADRAVNEYAKNIWHTVPAK